MFRLVRALGFVVLAALAAPAVPSSQTRSFVITGAQVADGSGGPLRLANVRVTGDTIAAVGAVTPSAGDMVVDGAGLVLAPGFIDAHNHSTEGLEKEPAAITQVSQGITTLAVGQDGSSPWPLAGYVARLRANPPSVNVVVLAGHATIRQQVMGADYKRKARPAENARMRALVDQAMTEGAAGLSSGLEYEVGSYSDIEEVIEMARAAGAKGGFYISHIRDEADLTMDAVREAIAIGERAKLPVQITHIKLGTQGVWGKATEVVALVEAARKRGVDVTADAYPYLAWQSTPRVLIPNKKYDDPVSVKRGLDDIGGAKNVQITRWAAYPQHVGKRLDEAARAEGLSDIEAYVRFAKDENAGMIGHAMIEADLRAFYQQPWVMVASDGGIANNHPRGAGTFPRVLGLYVREKQWLTLSDAIRKMTAMPAARLGLKDRGMLREGMKADLVLFDPATVIDHSTFEQPRALATGIAKVWVNGGLVWTGTAPGTERSGRVLTLPLAAAPAAAQTASPAPQGAQPGARTASVNTAPRVDAAAMVRPIEMHDSVWIEHLTMLEVRDLIKAGSTIALILTGGIEENGPYLTTGKHNNVLKATGESIARALGKTLVAPIVTLEPGNPLRPKLSPGTIVLSPATYKAVLTDMANSLKSQGFTNVVMIGDSGGNLNAMKEVAAATNAAWAGSGARVHFIPEYYNYADVEAFEERELGIHEKMEGLHDDYYISAIIATVDTDAIRMPERVKAGKFVINGVPLAPIEKTIANGKRMVEFRTQVTVAAIRAALAKP